MKLAIKITGAIFIVTTLLLIVNTFFSVHREIKLFDEDMRGDAELLGDGLKSLIVNVWQNNGEYQAIQVIKNLNENQSNMHIQWIWFDDLMNDPFIPSGQRQLLLSILKRRQTTFLEVKHPEGRYLHTFVPVQIDYLKLGAIELSESLAQRNHYVTATIFRAVVLILGLLVFNGMALWLLGIKIVGRPLQRLVAKTQRISDGDLTADLSLKGRDELTKLADAINQMCGHLSAAREKVRLETERRIAALEQLRHSERLATVGRLSSGIAHELGTPLNVVAGRAKMIATESLTPEENREFATIIHEQAERMTKIIRQLLDFSRRRAPQRSSVSISSIFAQIKDMLAPIAGKSNVEIVLNENSSLPAVELDQGQIQQVLINLVMNAIQAMPHGGRVALSAAVENDAAKAPKDKKVVITVTDSGKGISEKDLEHVFEPFFTTKEIGVGTGLGLSIVYGIIEEHGGHIAVKSEPGKGTRFTITLPMKAKK